MSLVEQLPKLLSGVHPKWLELFGEEGLDGLASVALGRIEKDADNLAPQKNLIFEPFRLTTPEDVSVLVLGQDPYGSNGGLDAQGVAFSIPHGRALTGSLKSIIGNLEAHGLARNHYLVQDDVSSEKVWSGDLGAWAVQGVLLINAALTNRAGARGAHRGAWKEFTTKLIRVVSARAVAAKRPFIAMLWGNDARAFAPCVSDGGTVYHWTHPSPQINNRLPPVSRFENAPHFVSANAELRAFKRRPVEWDPLGYTFAFTDGGCLKNGEADASGSFAVFILTGPLRNVELRGPVPAREMKLADEKDPSLGFVETSRGAAPTNNRAEYLAWCWVLLFLLRGRVRGRVEVVSDCNLFIQTMESWLPARKRKGTEAQLKNFDLVKIGEALLDALKKGCEGVRLTHVNSHQKRPGDGTPPKERAFWYGNDRVDRTASAVLKEEAPAFLLTASPALEWNLHGKYAP